LWDNHPPFQIDGNFGATAGVAEMLLQSHDGEIKLLPALPDVWQSGEVKGLKARNNVEVDITWHEKEIITTRLQPTYAGELSVRFNKPVDNIHVVNAATGKKIKVRKLDTTLVLPVEGGLVYELTRT